MSAYSAAPLRLICFPYAGGSSWIFRQMAGYLRGRVEVLPVDLPGRGKRHSERRIDGWSELSALLVSELMPQLHAPYALLGYSLGALVALNVAHEIASQRSSKVQPPTALVACALSGPQTLEHPQLLHRMEDRAMFEALRGLGGIPDELMASPELIALSAPSMRADLRLFETFQPKGMPLRGVPVHVYYGRDDDSVGADVASWRVETDAALHGRAFDGGHMFIHDHAAALAEALVVDLDTDHPRLRSA